MPKNITWKLVLIGASVALSVWLFYPPKDKISLGLDLQGGSHLLLQVETSAAVKSEIDLAINRIGQLLKERNIPYSAVTASPDGSGIDLAGTDPARASDVREILDTIVGGWGVKPSGADWAVRIPDPIRKQIEAASVE